ncbi:MAG: diguanylate cyclase [Lachnospiraceae bacterium]|nr:diguanylate cyclase [Lachnospiraceae bacterium]
MKRYKKPMYRSITIGCIAFIIILSVALSVMTYIFYSQSIYGKYEEEMTNILNLVESQIDEDDLYDCVNMLTESKTYKKLQKYMDNFVDNYNVHYLYILKPLNTNPEDNVMSVCSANSTYEKEHDPDNVLHLGDTVGDAYSPELAQRFFDIMEQDEIVFFEEKTEWSIDYTAALPIKNSAGEAFAVLCVDESTDVMHSEIRRNIILDISFISALGLIFIAIFLAWMHHNITSPIHSLENSVYNFAKKSQTKNDPDELIYEAPEIHTDNEVESLSNAINTMSNDIHDYVVSLVEAEESIRKLDNVARQDNLTKVGNKYSYDMMETSLNHDIKAHDVVVRFALMMVDINYLKRVNDTYGHNRGNEYILGICGIICSLFGKENVYRIGGDEFVVVISGNNYYKRDELEESLIKLLGKAEHDDTVSPWRRYSASVGMAVYNSEKDTNVDSVFKRADARMYKRKTESKKDRV